MYFMAYGVNFTCADDEFVDRVGRIGVLRFRRGVRPRWKCMMFGSRTPRKTNMAL